MSARKEELLNAIINGNPVTMRARTRAETYLLKCINGTCEGLPAPKSRLDALYFRLAEIIVNGGAGANWSEYASIIVEEGA